MSLFDRLVREVAAERQRQDEKWGIQNHPMVFDDSLRDTDYWRGIADAWKRENDHRVARSTMKGLPRDRNCAWDGILGEEMAETFAEERPGLQYAEAVQTAGVAFAILDFLNRQSMELRGHYAGCPALDVDGLIHAPEACDCKDGVKLERYVARVWDNTKGILYGVWDSWSERWVDDHVKHGVSEAAAQRQADTLNAKVTL